MSIFSTDSKLYKFMSRFTDILVLNFLWVLCSLPVVTIGVSTIAACSVAMKMNEDKEGKIARDFFREFKSNFKQGLPMSFISVVSVWAVYLDLQLVAAAEEHVILFIIAATLAIYILGFSQLYVYPLLARYRNTIFRSLKNSFSISMRYFFRSILLIIVLAVELGLIFWNKTTMLLGALIGPAVFLYTISGMAIGIFRDLEKRPETVVDRSAEEKFDGE